MNKFYLFPFVVFFLQSILFSQTIIPIDSARINDSNGVPLNNNKSITVSGIVTSSNQFGSSGPGSIQDLTGGIAIYGGSFVSKFSLGDSVVVTGTLTNYNGLAEISNGTGSSANVISSGHQIDPEVVTISQIVNQKWNGVEEYESKLIRINNVSISGSGNFTGGTSGYNYDISDPTGTLQQGLRIDASVSSIIGTPIPSGKVDVIGILSQYKTSAPYNSGYQLLPRSISDIVYDGSPLILNPVFASDIDTSSFTVYFHTARNGNSIVKYGQFKSLEMDSVVVNDDTTFHSVTIAGLKSYTLYYFQALSKNNIGLSKSSIQSVYTLSTNPGTGTINIYFNYPVDTSVALPGNAANGKVNFESKLINRINSTKYSIDMAVYSFADMPDVANALILAKQRGVRVRVVYDNRNMQNSMQMLLDAGIKMSQRPANLSGIMHNKFFIFDARDTISSNDWLWTGSWNVTATELNWKNNVVEINDPNITKAYQTEFEEMWGSNTDTPDPSKAKFGNQKTDNTPHSFTIGGKQIYLYFSPSDGTTSRIINSINSADDDIYLAQFTVTRNDIGDAINSRYNAGIKDIRGVVNNINDSGSEYSYLKTFADMHPNSGSTLHDKYGLVDAEDLSSDPIVITGSHNWSTAAETVNDENTLIIHDAAISNFYLQDFKQRYNDAGGTGEFSIPTGVNDKFKVNKFSYNLYQNYPNPFNPVTTISLRIPYTQHIDLSVYNMLGQKVKTIYNGTAKAGIMDINFQADNLASGIYIYRIKAGSFISSKKMLLLK